MWFGIFLSLSLVGAGVWLSFKERTRSAKDVTLDIAATFDEETVSGLVNRQAPRSFTKVFPILAAAITCFVRAVLMKSDLPGIVFPSLLAASVVYLIQKRMEEGRSQRRVKDIEYFLPIVMERLVMAVESGLDIVPALQTIIEIEVQHVERTRGAELDPVTTLFAKVIRLANAGTGFDAALNEVSKSVPCPALKHAFIHLGVAFRDGGEIIGPLRELSDATQAYFQESVEEEIAKMPVKATMPLVLTFAGLITFFIASPVVQIVSFASQAVPK